MLEPHQRAALIENDSGVSWHHFLMGRFVGPLPAGSDSSLAIVVQRIEQQSQEHAELSGLLEFASGSSLPVVSEFVGVVNLETRELSIQQTQPDSTHGGQISENGRVMMLRRVGESKPIYLVHDETLAHFI